MNRYSTITFETEFDFAIDNAADIWVSLVQGKTKITKKKSARQLTTSGNVAKVTLTQRESASFEAYMPIAVQARWLMADGQRDSSTIEYISLGDVLEEGVM